MRIELAREYRFEAAHRLPRLPATHKCAQTHGHSFRVDVVVQGVVNPELGWLMDYADVAAAWAPLHGELDHKMLNEVIGLDNPTSENLAWWIWQRLSPRL